MALQGHFIWSQESASLRKQCTKHNTQTQTFAAMHLVVEYPLAKLLRPIVMPPSVLFRATSWHAPSDLSSEILEIIASWFLFFTYVQVDVEDVCAAAQHLTSQNMVDPARLCIDGGSAGGYTVLACLAFKSTFKAGASMYGYAESSEEYNVWFFLVAERNRPRELLQRAVARMCNTTLCSCS